MSEPNLEHWARLAANPIADIFDGSEVLGVRTRVLVEYIGILTYTGAIDDFTSDLLENLSPRFVAIDDENTVLALTNGSIDVLDPPAGVNVSNTYGFDGLIGSCRTTVLQCTSDTDYASLKSQWSDGRWIPFDDFVDRLNDLKVVELPTE